jgi:hypothetical protein
MKANALQKTLTIATLGFGLAACSASPGKDSATAALNPTGARLSKTQCLSTYPERPGSLFLRQKCLSDVAFAGEARLTPAQKDIIDGCAKELLTLANKGDKAMIALDAYQVQKDLLLAKCSTALAKVTPK